MSSVVKAASKINSDILFKPRGVAGKSLFRKNRTEKQLLSYCEFQKFGIFGHASGAAKPQLRIMNLD